MVESVGSPVALTMRTSSPDTRLMRELTTLETYLEDAYLLYDSQQVCSVESFNLGNN